MPYGTEREGLKILKNPMEGVRKGAGEVWGQPEMAPGPPTGWRTGPERGTGVDQPPKRPVFFDLRSSFSSIQITSPVSMFTTSRVNL